MTRRQMSDSSQYPASGAIFPSPTFVGYFFTYSIVQFIYESVVLSCDQ